MKKSRILSFLTSAVLTVSALCSTLSASAETATYKYGDFDLSGNTDISDIVGIRSSIVNVTFVRKNQRTASDINKDTQTDIIDIVLLRDAIVNSKDLGTFTVDLYTGSRRIYTDGTKLMVGGKEIWINGTNSSWDNWNDFGGDFDYDFWESHFKDLHDSGVNATRIWISCNGDVGMNFDENGYFTGATQQHWEDLDKLFELAEKYQVYVMPTVMSFDHFKNKTKTLWREMVQDSDKIDSYVENYIIPLVKRYNDNDFFWCVDLCNEPDWIHENRACGKLEWDNISELFARSAAAIHENSDILVTVGIGYIKYNSDRSGCKGNMVSDSYLQSLYNNENAYLDFYSTHYYEWMEEWYGDPFKMSLSDYGLDGTKPFVMGETAAVGVSGYTLLEEYQAAYDNGWNGIMSWKASGHDDGCGLLPDVIKATIPMANEYIDLIYPLD
ncbi:MAG: cellulase (glycosyl hydrolase family 5) [Oscillospiraceae bacterium]